MITDLRNPLPKGESKTFNDYAEELLANFPGVDRAKLLKTIVALTIMDIRYGRKREERAACDLLNLVQEEAVKQLKASAGKLRKELEEALLSEQESGEVVEAGDAKWKNGEYPLRTALEKLEVT